MMLYVPDNIHYYLSAYELHYVLLLNLSEIVNIEMQLKIFLYREV